MLLCVTKHEDDKIYEPEAFQLDHIIQDIIIQILYFRHQCHLEVEIILDESVYKIGPHTPVTFLL